MLKSHIIPRITFAFLATALWSCAPYSSIKATDQASNSNTSLGADGSCSVSQETDGAMITCPDGSMAFVPNGTNGTNGKDGLDGQDGTNGVDGINGTNGSNGADGSSCSVQDLGGKALLTCTDGTTAIIENGKDGKNGTNGTDGQNEPVTQFPLVNIIKVCGEKGSELLLQFANGEVFGSYELDQKYMATIAPGMKQSKSETHCAVSVTAVKH